MMNDLQAAATEVLRCVDAYRDAVNGDGHKGEDHDRILHFEPCTNLPGVEHVYDYTGDCSACGGAQYGTEDALTQAYGDLRATLGLPRKPWEYER